MKSNFKVMKKSFPLMKQSTIKEVTEHHFDLGEYLDNEMKKGGSLSPKYTISQRYFEDGREIETARSRKGKLENQTLYYYNEKKLLVEVVELDFSGSSESSGNFLKSHMRGKKVYKYNKKNRLIGTVNIGPKGIQQAKTVIHYNRQGLMKEEIHYYGMENMYFKLEYSYNEKSQLVSETYSSTEEMDDPTITFFEYLNEGREKISTTKNIYGEIIYKIIDVFDERGNEIISKHYEANGDLAKEYFLNFDGFNNLLTREIKIYAENNLIEHYLFRNEFDYNKMNNWIKWICHQENEESSFVITREIVYY